MDGWSFSKEIPLSFLLLMAVQIIAFVIYLTRLGSRAKEMERDIHRLSVLLESIPKQIPPREVLDRLTKIEGNQTFIITSLRQIATRLDMTLIPTESD